VPLKEIVTSSRRHFKNLTECNFEALKGQVLEYQAKLEKLGVSEQQLNRHRALMATNEMNSDQIELETQQLIEKGIRRGLKPGIDKAAIKYQVISRKMDEAMQRESSLETARDNLRNTQTNLSVMRTIDRWEENSRIFNTPKNSVFHGDSMRQT
jgi:flagellar biosynthesis/type III secretory pathway protein FliH